MNKNNFTFITCLVYTYLENWFVQNVGVFGKCLYVEERNDIDIVLRMAMIVAGIDCSCRLIQNVYFVMFDSILCFTGFKFANVVK